MQCIATHALQSNVVHVGFQPKWYACTYLGLPTGLCMSCICTVGASKRSSEEVRAVLEIVWAVAVQPLVMGLAGASIHFDTLPSGVALKALAVTAIGEHGHKPIFTLHVLILILSIQTACVMKHAYNARTEHLSTSSHKALVHIGFASVGNAYSKT